MSHFTHKLLHFILKNKHANAPLPRDPRRKTSGVLARQTSECTDVFPFFFFNPLPLLPFFWELKRRSRGSDSAVCTCSGILVANLPDRAAIGVQKPLLILFSLRRLGQRDPLFKQSDPRLAWFTSRWASRNCIATGASVQPRASLVFERRFQ